MKKSGSTSSRTLLAFFKPEDQSTSTGDATVSRQNDEIRASTSDANAKPEIKLSDRKMSGPPYLDIGMLKENDLNLDEVKGNLLSKQWENPSSYEFPSRSIGGKQRKLNAAWLKEHALWMRYSESKDCVYCVYCLLFGRNDPKAKTFGYYSPVTDWANLGQLVKRHTHSDSTHHGYVQMGTNYTDIMSSKKVSVISSMSSCHKAEVEKNKHIMRKIIEVILLCAHQNIPMRGHVDDKSNFFSILSLVAKDDPILSDHLSFSKVKYTSPEIQNEIINICGEQVEQFILEKCADDYFALLADETTDKSTKTQLSVCLRFVDETEGVASVQEYFLGFVHAPSIKGKDICELLLEFMREKHINIDKMRAQGYDGASNMSGRINGVQALMKQHAPNATYVHCKAHCLNLAVVQSCKEPCVRTMMAAVQEIGFAFHYSAKRMDAFQQELDNSPNVKDALQRKTKIVKLCETRWTSRADALTSFKTAFPVVVQALEHLQENNDDKAGLHLNAILRYDFIIALVVCEHILKIVVHLSYFLQEKSCDMISAMEECRVVMTQLRGEREDETVWNSMFEEANQIAHEFDIEPSMPRRTGRQQHRANVPAENPSDYWRRCLYYVFLDHMMQELEDRLLQGEQHYTGFLLMPRKIEGITDAQTEIIFRTYQADVEGDFENFSNEVSRWRTRWSIRDKPDELIDVLNQTAKQLYPSICNILIILLVLPVSTATAERSFSVLRRIKTYLRTTTGQERLSALALSISQTETNLFVHH